MNNVPWAKVGHPRKTKHITLPPRLSLPRVPGRTVAWNQGHAQNRFCAPWCGNLRLDAGHITWAGINGSKRREDPSFASTGI